MGMYALKFKTIKSADVKKQFAFFYVKNLKLEKTGKFAIFIFLTQNFIVFSL